ncbi:condensation domain-containing protein [Globomyces pollinis-pini]|nr:condensation domain-containing protein [Globomyces pollinis-pini]
MHAMSQDNDFGDDIGINCYHNDDRLELSMSYFDQASGALIQSWGNLWKEVMEELVVDLFGKQGVVSGFTSSDFDLLNASTDMNQIETQITSLVKLSLNEVEDIYPATAMQAGLLSSMIRDPSEYTVQIVYSITGEFDIARLRSSWSKVVEQHSILRTSFVATSDGIFQVVSNGDHSIWSAVDDCKEENVQTRIEEILQEDRKLGFHMNNQNFVRFCTMNVESGRMILFLTIHHSIVDGWSMGVMIGDWLKSYNYINLESGMQFREHVKNIFCHSGNLSEEYWNTKFKNVKYYPQFDPNEDLLGSTREYVTCQLPLNMIGLAILRKDLGITLNSVFQSAWGLVLARVFGLKEIVFGCVNSGRDSVSEGSLSCVGLMISTLPVMFNYDENTTIYELLEIMKQEYIGMIQHSHNSLLDVRRWAGTTSKMFDTIIRLQNYPKIDQDLGVPFKLDVIESVDIYEYPISLLGYVANDQIHFELQYSPKIIQKSVANQLTNQLKDVFERILTGNNCIISEFLEKESQIDTKHLSCTTIHKANANDDLPSTENEILLSRIWSRFLEVDVTMISRQTTFRELGGDSFKMIQLISILQKSGWTIDTKLLYASQTLQLFASLANHSEVEEIEISMQMLLDMESEGDMVESTVNEFFEEDFQDLEPILIDNLLYKDEFESRPMKIVCFHGNESSALLLEKQLAGVKYYLGTNVEFSFIEAPYKLMDTNGLDGKKREWWNNNSLSIYQSLTYISEQLSIIGYVDGLLGVSEGGRLIEIMDHVHLETETKRLWDFSILVSDQINEQTCNNSSHSTDDRIQSRVKGVNDLGFNDPKSTKLYLEDLNLISSDVNWIQEFGQLMLKSCIKARMNRPISNGRR